MTRRQLTRREFLTLVGAGSATLAAGDTLGTIAQAAEKASAGGGRKPNIIVILADDLGYGELGMQGNKQIPTPNIDSIAKGGVRFTNGYVSCPLCSPTRAGLITGRYQQRFGHESNPGPNAPPNFGLPLTETTIASRLKSAGYRTGMVGKWHLGQREGYFPNDRGFDEFFGFLRGGNHYLPQDAGSVPSMLRNGKEVKETRFLTEAFGEEAKAFVEKHKAEPFFLYLAFNAVHVPMQVTDKYLKRFSSIDDNQRRTFAAMLSAMDDAVGEVLKAVRDNGLEKDTLIFFLGDNGGPTRQTTCSNLPLRGAKGIVYEGGIRVPYCVQWKGHLPEGKTYDKPVMSLDIAPTAVAAAGAEAKEAKFDGANLLPFLTKESDKIPHEALYWKMGVQRACRKGDWKLMKNGGQKPQLYDLSKDIAESTNLYTEKPEKAKEMEELYAKWESELVKPLWGGAANRTARPARQRRQQRNAGQTGAGTPNATTSP